MLSAQVASLLFFSTLASSSHAAPASSNTQQQQQPIINKDYFDISNSCTFTLFQRQRLSPDFFTQAKRRENYIYIPVLHDHANDLTITIAGTRPAEYVNSYTKIDEGHAFAMRGLLDDAELVVKSADNQDWVRFETGGTHWYARVGDRRTGGEAMWCDVGEWDGEFGERGWGNRERKLECGFPCEKAEEFADEEVVVVDEEEQQQQQEMLELR